MERAPEDKGIHMEHDGSAPYNRLLGKIRIRWVNIVLQNFLSSGVKDSELRPESLQLEGFGKVELRREGKVVRAPEYKGTYEAWSGKGKRGGKWSIRPFTRANSTR